MSRNQRVFFQVMLRVAFFVVCFFISNDAMALTAITLSGINTKVGSSIKSILAMIQDVAVAAGVGLVLSSFFKFHQHKMNPTQVPLSQGVTLLAVGSALLVFPHILGSVSTSAFGTGAGGGGSIASVIKVS